MVRNKKAVAAAVVAVLLVGFFAGSITSRDRQIVPTPLKDRSKMKFIGRAARTVLWFMMFGDNGGSEQKTYVHRHPERDSKDFISHSEGW